jgi:DNA-binding transcriptional ArsR family regulator
MPAEPRSVDPGPRVERPRHDWLDNDAGPVVRPYALTQGRVAPTVTEFDLVAFVVATMPDAPAPPHLHPEHHAIIAASWEPMSVAELASKLDLSIGVVRVLLGDLRSAGLISLYEPPEASRGHDIDVLKAVVNGLRAL